MRKNVIVQASAADRARLEAVVTKAASIFRELSR